MSYKLIPITDVEQLKVGTIIKCELGDCKQMHRIIYVDDQRVDFYDQKNNCRETLFWKPVRPDLLKCIYIVKQSKSKLPSWF